MEDAYQKTEHPTEWPSAISKKLKFGVEHAIWIHKKRTLPSFSDGRIGCQSQFLTDCILWPRPHMYLLIYHYYQWGNPNRLQRPFKGFSLCDLISNQIQFGIKSPIANVKLVFTNLVRTKGFFHLGTSSHIRRTPNFFASRNLMHATTHSTLSTFYAFLLNN